MRDTLLSVAVLVSILVLSALVTNWFARNMYNHCPKCKTMNAKRRAHCRNCGEPLG
ncbi:MAG: hypothetical protein LC802_13605 [Acidobacteria bacterium]|nr:hypothetical protein [Acidobacteriota bacterium]